MRRALTAKACGCDTGCSALQFFETINIHGHHRFIRVVIGYHRTKLQVFGLTANVHFVFSTPSLWLADLM
jgi:hypothetical protein